MIASELLACSSRTLIRQYVRRYVTTSTFSDITAYSSAVRPSWPTVTTSAPASRSASMHSRNRGDVHVLSQLGGAPPNQSRSIAWGLLLYVWRSSSKPCEAASAPICMVLIENSFRMTAGLGCRWRHAACTSEIAEAVAPHPAVPPPTTDRCKVPPCASAQASRPRQMRATSSLHPLPHPHANCRTAPATTGARPAHCEDDEGEDDMNDEDDDDLPPIAPAHAASTSYAHSTMHACTTGIDVIDRSSTCPLSVVARAIASMIRIGASVDDIPAPEGGRLMPFLRMVRSSTSRSSSRPAWFPGCTIVGTSTSKRFKCPCSSAYTSAERCDSSRTWLEAPASTSSCTFFALPFIAASMSAVAPLSSATWTSSGAPSSTRRTTRELRSTVATMSGVSPNLPRTAVIAPHPDPDVSAVSAVGPAEPPRPLSLAGKLASSLRRASSLSWYMLARRVRLEPSVAWLSVLFKPPRFAPPERADLLNRCSWCIYTRDTIQ